MRTTYIVGALALSLFLVSLHGQVSSPDQTSDLKPNPGVKITFEGYVRDLACLVKFKGALKPTNGCAEMCARAGSPLIIVTDRGTIYTPISDAIPDASQQARLMPFVGHAVKVTGRVFQRSGIRALVIDQIEETNGKP